MEIAIFLHHAAFSVVLTIMLCLLPQVCELLIINDIFLSDFSPFGALLLSSQFFSNTVLLCVITFNKKQQY